MNNIPEGWRRVETGALPKVGARIWDGNNWSTLSTHQRQHPVDKDETIIEAFEPHAFIPFGYRKLADGEQTVKGDGIHSDGKFRKVKRHYPRVWPGEIVIRKCAVEQTELIKDDAVDLD